MYPGAGADMRGGFDAAVEVLGTLRDLSDSTMPA